MSTTDHMSVGGRARAEGPLLPLERDYTGRWKVLTWTLTLFFACVMWTAVWALVFA